MEKIHVFSFLDLFDDINHLNSISTEFQLILHEIPPSIDVARLTEEDTLPFHSPETFLSQIQRHLLIPANSILITDIFLTPGCDICYCVSSISIITFFSGLSQQINHYQRLSLIFTVAILIKERKFEKNIPFFKKNDDFLFFVKLLLEYKIKYSNTHYFKQLIEISENQPVLAGRHLVFISHGIRTRANWMEDARKVLQGRDFKVQLLRPGLINTIKYIFRIDKDSSSVFLLKKIIDSINDKQYESYKISFITHSYGCLLLYSALHIANSLKIKLDFENIILNGSVVPEHSDFDYFLSSNNTTSSVKINRLINLCGDSDVWPLFSKILVPGTGSSGTFFFSENSDSVFSFILEDTDHKKLTSVDTCNHFWVNFLLNNTWTPSNKKSLPKPYIRFLDFLSAYLSPYIIWPLIIFFIFYFVK